MAPEHPQVVAPRRKRLHATGFRPSPARLQEPARRPPGRVFDRAPIGSDVAHRAFVGASARICSAITALRHWVPFGALVRSALPTASCMRSKVRGGL